MDKVSNSKWLKAAVIGSIWAAIEIIVGSFLHNLRIPFAGAVMATSSVFLLTAFMQHWKGQFIILRAGIICALMKSISPSAVILGPMFGIFFEALILELVCLLLGRNLLAYMLAGGLAVFWALFQKVLSLLILYGFDLLKVLEALYVFLIKITGISLFSAWYLIGSISAIYLLAGAIAALGGYRQGNALRHKVLKFDTKFNSDDFRTKSFFKPESGEKHSFLLLFLTFAIVFTALFFLNKQLYWIAIPLGTAFTAGVIFRYRQSVRHLKKPGIWIQFALITLLAAFLWEWVSYNGNFSREGLRIGLEMNFRAIVIIFGFAAISSELRNPILKTLLYNYGFAQLYRSLNIAFSALPVITASLPRLKNLYRQRKHILAELFLQANRLLEYFAEETKTRKQIFLLTGDLQIGKTSFVQQLAERLKDKGHRVMGFTSPGIFENNERSKFYLHPLNTKKKYLLAENKKQKSGVSMGRFSFISETLAAGNRIIEQSLAQKTDFLIIDEIGPLELTGKGWAKSLQTAAKRKDIFQIWVIRSSQLNKAILNWNLSPENAIDVSKLSIEKALIFIEKKTGITDK